MVVSNSRWGYYIGFVLGFALAYVIAQMIAEKTFHIADKVKKIWIFGGIAAGLYGVMIVITFAGFWGYISYLPQVQDVQGVNFWMSPFVFDGDGLTDEELDDLFVSDPDIIARAIAAHDLIIADRGNLRRLFRETIFRWQPDVENIFINYLLHTGETVSRRYIMSHDFMISSGLEGLLRSEPVIFSHYPILQRPENIHAIDISSRGAGFISGINDWFITDRNDLVSLVEYLRKDIIIDHVEQRQVRFGETRPPEFSWGDVTGLFINIIDDPSLQSWGTTIHLTRSENIQAWFENWRDTQEDTM